MHKRMLHTGIAEGEIGRYVFIPGSVERARLISQFFDNPKELAHRREFLTYTGLLNGVPVAVTSTGIGGPSMSLCVEELMECGADTFLRIGSCASAAPISKIGDLMIPSGAVRMEGVSQHFLPIEFPAVPDYELFSHIVNAAKESGYPFNTGVSITKDSFYTEAAPETKPVYEELLYKWKAYEKAGATNTCMECAPLFILGSTFNIRTAAVLICATNFNVYSNDMKDYPKGWEMRAIEVGIAAMKSIIKADMN